MGTVNTVVLLDPALPTLFPVEAISRIRGAVLYTEELPVKVAWNLPDAQPLLASTVPEGATLVSSNPRHSVVRALIEEGAQVIGTATPTGLAVVDTVALLDHLRVNGPWESEQTHASLLHYLVEETYELADAVAQRDTPGAGAREQAELCSELGDLLLQVIFHARIAEESPVAPFGIDDVARTLAEKVRRRTPHLADGSAIDVATQTDNWERQKKLERAARGDRDGAAPSILDSIALGQPSLALASKVFERLRGADFPSELIPAEVRTVALDPARADNDAELSYRRSVLAFMDRVRAAEALMHNEQVDSWAAAWGGPDSGNSQAPSSR